MTRDSFGLLVPAAMPHINVQQVTVLRLLGRLEFLTTEQIHRLVYPARDRDTVLYHLRDLVEKDLIWRSSVPFQVLPSTGKAGRRGPPMRLPYVYGLMRDGRAILDALDAEPDRRSLDALKAREPGSRQPGRLTLAHDLQVSWWCSSLLLGLRQNALVRSVFVQVEFVIHERQRTDALVIIRLSRTPQQLEAGRWLLFDGTPRCEDEVEVRLALEVDRGTEPLPVLLAKGAAYRDLHAQGTYAQAFGGPVLPVFLAPTARRAGQIAREWRDIWPDGWGVVSTPRGAAASPQGVLWGDYRSLLTAEPFPLLSIAGMDTTAREVRWSSLVSQEEWNANNQTPDTQRSEQAAG